MANAGKKQKKQAPTIKLPAQALGAGQGFKWYRPFRSSVDGWMGGSVSTPRLRIFAAGAGAYSAASPAPVAKPLPAAFSRLAIRLTFCLLAVVLWMGGLGFVGARYYEDTVSGKLGRAVELTMAGNQQRVDPADLPPITK